MYEQLKTAYQRYRRSSSSLGHARYADEQVTSTYKVWTMDGSIPDNNYSLNSTHPM